MTALADVLEGVPPWGIMWVLAGVLFYAAKLAQLNRRVAGETAWRYLGWFAFWPGMDAGAFFRSAATPVKGIHWVAPLGNIGGGVALLYGLAPHLPRPLAAGWVGMVGLILVLHFGIFALLASGWQAMGVPVTPLMNCPVASTSLAEFWGQRWNRAFRDLTHRLIFRPAARAWGHRLAWWIAFLSSGLIHELVISVPAGAGYGLPTLYFVLQAGGIALERHWFGHLPPDAQLAKRWCFTHLFTAGPAFFLFHPPFVERVMLPFFTFIQALP